jgi:hypothetical protein
MGNSQFDAFVEYLFQHNRGCYDLFYQHVDVEIGPNDGGLTRQLCINKEFEDYTEDDKRALYQQFEAFRSAVPLNPNQKG